MVQSSVFVTGASGFTGSWLTEHLLTEGATVTTLLSEVEADSIFVRNGLRERVRTIDGSILDFDLLVQVIANFGIDAVFHLAAVSVEGKAHGSPRQSFEVNIRGSYNVLEACRLNANLVKKVIVASSDKVYGDNPDLPFRETMPIQGMNAYDVSKSCVDLIARSYHHSYGLPVAVARFANIYGGGDLNWSRLVPNTIRRLLHSEPPVVRSPSSNVFKRDFLYVKDQVRAYMCLFHALNRPSVCGQAFNFGMGLCLAVPDVVTKIQRFMCRPDIVPIVEPCDHGEILHQQLLSEKANRELGWAPAYSFDEGLSETIEWYKRFFDGATRARNAED
jgi:CDP-glucose 4,6-dehydratase